MVLPPAKDLRREFCQQQSNRVNSEGIAGHVLDISIAQLNVLGDYSVILNVV